MLNATTTVSKFFADKFAIPKNKKWKIDVRQVLKTTLHVV